LFGGVGEQMWKRLYQRLITDEGLELVRPSVEKIDAALDRVEADLGIRLPAGYRAFIHQFGPGEIGGYFRIYGPPITGFRDYGNDILEENRSWREPDGAWASSGDPKLVARPVCFSTTIGGDACFWDPEDVRNSRAHEYGIYVLSRGNMDMKVEEAASSFKEFIEKHCLANEFVKIVGGNGWAEAEGGVPPQRFLAAWRTKKAGRR
jgi:hypothetical protein